MNIPLSPCVPENLVSQDGFSRPVPRQPAHLHTQAESGAYLRDPSRVPRRRPFMKPPYAIGSVPSLWGHVITYRWRSLPRVRRHRASKPQGSSEGVLPWPITMNQLAFASLSHTHYWYEVGILKVPAVVKAKSRLVACDFKQREGVDFGETFAPTVSSSCVHLLSAIACECDLDICHFVVDHAFVQSDLEEGVFLRLPKRCGDLPGKVVRLNKSLYGLKQASRTWHTQLTTCLKRLLIGFEQ